MLAARRMLVQVVTGPDGDVRTAEANWANAASPGVFTGFILSSGATYTGMSFCAFSGTAHMGAATYGIYASDRTTLIASATLTAAPSTFGPTVFPAVAFSASVTLTAGVQYFAYCSDGRVGSYSEPPMQPSGRCSSVGPVWYNGTNFGTGLGVPFRLLPS